MAGLTKLLILEDDRKIIICAPGKRKLRLSIPAVTWQDNTGLSNCNVTLTLLYLDELSLTP